MAMAMQAKRDRQRGEGQRGRLTLPVIALLAFAFVGLAFIVYVLWPRWPEAPVAADAPALPIVISGVMFNVPQAAIRMAVQRHPGPQERVDLVYLWPSLMPPEPPGKNGAAPVTADRVFVTIAGHAGTIAPTERLKIIYPRYADPEPAAGPDGLALFGFRDGTPYQGEDLLFDHTAPERFLVRCSRDSDALTPGACLYERFVGNANVTVRFPRDWLPDWRRLAAGFEKLIVQLRPNGG